MNSEALIISFDRLLSISYGKISDLLLLARLQGFWPFLGSKYCNFILTRLADRGQVMINMIRISIKVVEPK